MSYFRLKTADAEAALRAVELGREMAGAEALRVADEAIAGVRARGDAFVAEQVARFDGVRLKPDEINIPVRAVSIDRPTASAIDLAIERITSFHEPQTQDGYEWRDGKSVMRHRVRPLRRAGVYVPGGRAVYISTLLMCAVPARIAGVDEIAVAAPPAAAATDALHYACTRLGIRSIYRSGGAAAIAALALGTESLERVDKIVGPGNQYVTAAKARLVGAVGIDMTAGPTELIVIADDSADPTLVIADLLAQAEHGSDSTVILITTSETLAAQMPARALTFLATSLDEAVAITNRLAPEHCSVQTRDPQGIAERVENCGAVYCGPSSPVAAGDYVVGSNHVLPTGGTARFFSPLGVYDFVKRSNVITLDATTLAAISSQGETLARLEGLPAHAESIVARRLLCVPS